MRNHIIQDFIDQVERLQQYKFVEVVLNEQTGWIGSFDINGDFEEIIIGPDREEVDAALLIVRQFLQNNDAISIKNIVDLAHNYLTNEAKHSINEIRESLNKELDSYSPTGVEDKAKSYREIMDIFLYGEHAHTRERKRRDYKDIQTMDVSQLFLHYFYVAIRAVIVYSFYIKELLSDEISYKNV